MISLDPQCFAFWSRLLVSCAGFSEYATYLSWVQQRHPGSQRLAERVTWSRFGPSGWDAVVAAAKDAPDGLCCPTDAQIQVQLQNGMMIPPQKL